MENQNNYIMTPEEMKEQNDIQEQMMREERMEQDRTRNYRKPMYFGSKKQAPRDVYDDSSSIHYWKNKR